MHEAKTYVFYHGDCPDGFGGAYAAWKKLGDTAHYIPLKHGTFLENAMLEHIKGAAVYFVDFSYPKVWMDQVAAAAGALTILDHHEGVEAIVMQYPGTVYDTNRSGASIAWDYFHEGEPKPELIKYIQDDDLYTYALPETRSVISYLSVHPYDFAFWDGVAEKLQNDREKMLETMRIYAEEFMLMAELSANQAKLIEFEGYEVYFANTHPIKPMKSLVGNLLAKKKGPFALVVSAHPLGYGISIRGDGSVDVSKIAQKYGGNGHPSSAGFHVENDKPMPWKIVEHDVPEGQ